MPTIDADAHVVETERTWEYIEELDRKFKPLALTSNGKRYWLIDGRRIRRAGNIGEDTSEASREMKDIEARLRHMDSLGVDVQVLYPSLFLIPLTERPRVERVLTRSYNRWLAEIWTKGEKRLRWAAVIPTMNMEYALSEARFAKDNGACALYLRAGPHGTPGKRLGKFLPRARLMTGALNRLGVKIQITLDRHLSDPYFYPLFEEASRLDLPICIHASTGSYMWKEVFEKESGFSNFKLPVISTFHTLAYHEIPKRFPKLRIGFIEVGAQWVPYVLHDLAKRFQRNGKSLGNHFMRENRLYVACQTDDDLAYLLRYTGEDNMVIGSDYGHGDTATDIDALRKLQSAGEIGAEAVGKILCQNPSGLYNL